MVFDRLQADVLARIAALALTLAALAWVLTHTHWYLTISLLAIASGAQVAALLHAQQRTNRELARFLDAIAHDDLAASFSGLARSHSMAALGETMGRVMEQLRKGRAEREEQRLYYQSLIAHVPVALLTIADDGEVTLLNLAARRLFDRGQSHAPAQPGQDLTRYGDGFAAALERLAPGRSGIVTMQRAAGPIHLKATATGMAVGGRSSRLVALQNIASELSAQELAAWQSVIRVMAHEVTNSLTPITSLATSARDLVDSARAGAQPDPALLQEASDALEIVARRAEGLLHFVTNHRRLLRRMEARTEPLPVARVFARLQRLFADELAGRGTTLIVAVEPPSLTVEADPELLDQALINVLRNAMDATAAQMQATIELRGWRDPGGMPVLCVADDGPGIAPELREKVFVPFFTTRRQGSGVGLTLVRQIVAAHNATVHIEESAAGGTAVLLRF